MKNDLKLDIFPHIFPQSFFERMKGIAGANPALAASIKRWLTPRRLRRTRNNTLRRVASASPALDRGDT